MSRISQDEFEQLVKEHVPFIGALNIQIERLEAGKATIRLPFRDDFFACIPMVIPRRSLM